MSPSVRRLDAALDAIGAKHAVEPDAPARDWRYESEGEIELSGDDFARLESFDDL